MDNVLSRSAICGIVRITGSPMVQIEERIAGELRTVMLTMEEFEAAVIKIKKEMEIVNAGTR